MKLGARPISSLGNLTCQRLYDCRNNWWTNSITYQFDLVSPCASQKQMVIGESHRTTELGHLKHPDLVAFLARPDISKAIYSCYRPQRPIDFLPTTCPVRAV